MGAFQNFYKYLTRSVKEGEVSDKVLDHDYDSIHELDNRMPPWLAGIFYVTITFGIAYLSYYHLFGMGNSPAKDYAEEMVIGDSIKKLYAITADKAKMTRDKAVLEKSKVTFQKLCSPCHGINAQGKVGPNLTDDYWIHGGEFKNVFNTISEGVPEKGMLTWKDQLKPEEIEEIASYVVSIRGTNPATPKPAQGKKWSVVDMSGHATMVDSNDVSATPVTSK